MHAIGKNLKSFSTKLNLKKKHITIIYLQANFIYFLPAKISNLRLKATQLTSLNFETLQNKTFYEFSEETRGQKELQKKLKNIHRRLSKDTLRCTVFSTENSTSQSISRCISKKTVHLKVLDL